MSIKITIIMTMVNVCCLSQLLSHIFVGLFIAISTCNKLFGDSVTKSYTNTG